VSRSCCSGEPSTMKHTLMMMPLADRITTTEARSTRWWSGVLLLLLSQLR
jgi:hypothetical protein